MRDDKRNQKAKKTLHKLLFHFLAQLGFRYIDLFWDPNRKEGAIQKKEKHATASVDSGFLIPLCETIQISSSKGSMPSKRNKVNG